MSFWEILNVLSPGLPDKYVSFACSVYLHGEKISNECTQIRVCPATQPPHKAHPGHNHNFPLASPFASSWASCLGPHIPWVHYSSQNSPLNENMFLRSQKSPPKCPCTKVASVNGSVIVRSSSSHSTSLQSTSHCRMFVCLAHTGHPHLQRFLSSFSSSRRFSPDISTAHVLTLSQVFPSSTILWLTRL